MLTLHRVRWQSVLVSWSAHAGRGNDRQLRQSLLQLDQQHSQPRLPLLLLGRAFECPHADMRDSNIKLRAQSLRRFGQQHRTYILLHSTRQHDVRSDRVPAKRQRRESSCINSALGRYSPVPRRHSRNELGAVVLLGDLTDAQTVCRSHDLLRCGDRFCILC